MAKGRRSKKSSLAKDLIEVAAASAGAPPPVQRALATRWGTRIAFVVAVALFVSGVVTVQWSDSRPHLTVNRERAKAVKEAIVEEAYKLGVEKADRRDAPRMDDRPASY